MAVLRAVMRLRKDTIYRLRQPRTAITRFVWETENYAKHRVEMEEGIIRVFSKQKEK